MERKRLQILGSDDQFVLWFSLVVFVIITSVFFWQRSIHQGGVVDFDEIEPQPAVFLVDVNSARWQEFANLPGIGEKLAKEIVADREKNGQFEDAQQLTRVRGVGEMKLAAMRPFLRLEADGSGIRRE